MSAAVQTTTAAVDGRAVITLAALTATWMEAVNISLPNAALPHIQGALSMADDEVGWVFTAYLASGAAVMPMARWLAGRYGRNRVYLVSLAVFALGLVLNTLATTSIQLVLARIVQGAASGTLGPLSLAILLDLHPAPRHPRVTLTWSAAIVLGISSGASIGGWLSEYHGWQSIFYFSLPVVAFIALTTALWLPEKRADQSAHFDMFGWAAFTLGMIGLQMVLDRGERLEWFDSPEIWIEASLSALGFYLFIIHVATRDTHFFAKTLFADRNFILSLIMIFGAGFVLLPTLALTSPFLEALLNYPVDTAGYMTLARGVTLVGFVVLMGFAPARIDNRLFIVGGMAAVVYANSLMLGYSPQMDQRLVIAATLLQGAGLGTLLPSLGRAALSTLDPKLRPEATALFTLSRVYGATIGIAVVQVFFYNNTQAMHLALAKNLAPWHSAAHVVGAMSASGLARLNEMITQQAAVVGVIDQFEILMFAMLVVSPLVLFLRKPAN